MLSLCIAHASLQPVEKGQLLLADTFVSLLSSENSHFATPQRPSYFLCFCMATASFLNNRERSCFLCLFSSGFSSLFELSAFAAVIAFLLEETASEISGVSIASAAVFAQPFSASSAAATPSHISAFIHLYLENTRFSLISSLDREFHCIFRVSFFIFIMSHLY